MTAAGNCTTICIHSLDLSALNATMSFGMCSKGSTPGKVCHTLYRHTNIAVIEC